MTNPLDDLLNRLLGDWNSALRIEGDRVRLRLLRTNFEIWFQMPDPEKAAAIRLREGDAYAIPVGIRLINRNSGKDVRGMDSHYIHPWWLRQFVFELAAGVAYIEREWDVMSGDYITKMEEKAQ